MSCPDPLVLAAYAAGDLEPLERRAAEVHLVRCKKCRAHVLGLREVEAQGAQAAAEPEAPEAEQSGWGFAVGFLIALGVVALSLAALGRASSSPLSLSGVYAMAFDFFFFVRGRAPGLVELVVALGATATVAAIAALGVASLARRLGPPLVVLLALLGAEDARALDVRRTEGELRIAADETVAGSLAASAHRVEIDGRVEGDLFVGGDEVRIAGIVTGNVFSWARRIELAGRVEGSVHAASEELDVTGAIGGSAYLAAEQVRVRAGARIARDAYLFARGAELGGEVGRDVHFRGDVLAVEGRIARSLRVFHADRVAIRDGASVEGDFTIAPETSEGAREKVELAPGARIGGTYLAVDEAPAETFWKLEPWLWVLVQVAAALAFGVALYALLPGIFRVRVPSASMFLRLLGLGLATLVGVPVLLLVLAVTLVGLPLALLGGFLYATALYLAHVLAAAAVGRTVVRGHGGDLPGLGTFARILLVGLVVVSLAGHVPLIGPAVHVVIVLVGLGLLADQVRSLVRTPRPA
jgi:cytoskeletal protein CcmA (bactofilin family)